MSNPPPQLVNALARVRNLRQELRRQLDFVDHEASEAPLRVESDEDQIERRLVRLDRAVEDVVDRFVAGRVTGDQAARLLAALLPS